MNPQFHPSDPERDAAGEPAVREPYYAALSALVTRAQQNRAEMSRLHAERAELCAEAVALVAERVAQRAAARAAGKKDNQGIGDDIPLREVIAELGAALRVSDQTLRIWLGDGSALVQNYPATLEALRSGEVDERHASAIIDGGSGVTADNRAEYERRALEAAAELTAPALRDTARVIAARLQPDLVASRQQAAHENRRVRTYSLEDGLARLQADGPAALVLAMFDRLTQLAESIEDDPDAEPVPNDNTTPDTIPDPDESAPTASDERSRDQLRFDILSDIVLTATPTGHGDPDALGSIRGSVSVTIPVLTLAGLDDDPSVLAGHGPIDPDTARRIAGAASGWDRILTHPVTGIPVAVDRYRPSAEQRRFLIARDHHCRWPGCRRVDTHCDADHTIAYSDGGRTTAENLGLFCRRHHRLKHSSPWGIRQLGAGTLEFTSPTGRTYLNNAPPELEFVPPRWQTAYDPLDPAPF
ncbi:DUF222 domain-containing protein [Microbacterium sp.]|uniref:HNH endonuclease signature motif containing protein n=1 Tax=Microbacterium sp. TaxID=51671 RepID=UPI003C77A02B